MGRVSPFDGNAQSFPANSQPLSSRPAAQIFASRLLTKTVDSARTHSLLAFIVAVYWAAAQAVVVRYQVTPTSYVGFIRDDFAILAVLYLGWLLVGDVVYTLLIRRPESPIRYLWDDLVTKRLTANRLATILPAALLLPLAITSYGTIKAAIPLINPYSWDPILASFGRALYGGAQAWQWLQPLLGQSLITFALNVTYNLWYFVVFIVLLWQITSVSRPLLRMQFLLTWVLQWALLGNVVATLMSSVGPAFYSRLVGGPDPYAPLMQYLRSVHLNGALWAVKTQDSLWHCYMTLGPHGGCGISAMPSMHVAMAFSATLVACASNRWLGSAAAIFFALILIGSVLLGWHYASDGYASILGSLAIWIAVGWVLKKPKVSGWLALAG